MKMSTAFPGAHFKATDLTAGPIVATIAAVAMGKVGDDTKPIMKFYEFEQDLVLNVTNANILIEAFGDESAAWTGQQVQMYSTKVPFGSDMVDAIRLTPVALASAGAPPPAVAYGAVSPHVQNMSDNYSTVQPLPVQPVAGPAIPQAPVQPVPGFAHPQLPGQQPAQPQPAAGYPTAPPVPHNVLG